MRRGRGKLEGLKCCNQISSNYLTFWQVCINFHEGVWPAGSSNIHDKLTISQIYIQIINQSLWMLTPGPARWLLQTGSKAVRYCGASMLPSRHKTISYKGSCVDCLLTSINSSHTCHINNNNNSLQQARNVFQTVSTSEFTISTLGWLLSEPAILVLCRLWTVWRTYDLVSTLPFIIVCERRNNHRVHLFTSNLATCM